MMSIAEKFLIVEDIMLLGAFIMFVLLIKDAKNGRE